MVTPEKMHLNPSIMANPSPRHNQIPSMDFDPINIAGSSSLRPESQEGTAAPTNTLSLEGPPKQSQLQRPEQAELPPRKRARMACTWCRDRKVRCDVSIQGWPCTNCRLDHHECSIRPSMRRNRALGAAEPPKENAKDQQPPQVSFPRVTDGQEQSIDIPKTWNEKDLLFNRAAVPPPFDLKIPRSALPPTPNDFHSKEQNVIFSFYPFLELKSISQLPAEDVKFLEMKRCLHIPTRPILDEFVRHYFLHVHPCLPVLNEADFWYMYGNETKDDSNKRPSTMSLFTFRAMLFASCAFVPARMIKMAGFEDSRTARNTLYYRAKLLFDLNTEKDPLAKAQGAVLLTYQSSSTEFHAGSLWLTAAIQNAILCGAHMYECKPEADYEEDPLKNTKKRLWWSILLRDRILPLGLRRHPQITPQNFSLSLQCLTEEDLEDEINNSAVYDGETKRILATILRVQCELAIALTSVIMNVYAPNGFGEFKFSSEAAFSDKLKQLENAREDLTKWSNDAKTTLGSVVSSDKVHKSVSLYSGLTFVYYQAARLALCQFEALILETHHYYIGDMLEGLLGRIRDELENAESCITNSVREFLTRGVAHHLPISAIAYTALPLLLTALDVKLSVSTSQVATRKRRLRYYAQVMELYKNKYDGTDGVAVFIQQILRFADTLNLSFMFPKSCGAKRNESYSWPEIFTRKPGLYLRLSLMLDYSFTRGGFPRDVDLPESVRELHVDKSLAASPSGPAVPEPPGPRVSLAGDTFHPDISEIQNIQDAQHQQEEQSQSQSQQPVPPPKTIMPTTAAAATFSQNPAGYLDFQNMLDAQSPIQEQPTSALSPPPFQNTFTMPTQHLYQQPDRGSKRSYEDFEDFEHPNLNYFNSGDLSPGLYPEPIATQPGQGVNVPYDYPDSGGVDFSGDFPVWTDHMLNQILDGPSA